LPHRAFKASKSSHYVGDAADVTAVLCYRCERPKLQVVDNEKPFSCVLGAGCWHGWACWRAGAGCDFGTYLISTNESCACVVTVVFLCFGQASHDVVLSPALLLPPGLCLRRPKATTMPALSTFDFEAVKDYTCCLHLDGQGYTGTIPTEIGLMTNLENGFYLSRNALTGTIPTQIGMLTELRSDFVLSDNSLTGTIPSQVFTRRHLHVVPKVYYWASRKRSTCAMTYCGEASQA